MRLVGPQSKSKSFGEVIILSPIPEFETQVMNGVNQSVY
jgi:hypothetical protein